MFVLANITALKIVEIGEITFTAGVFPIAISFFATDIISEVYGKKRARAAVLNGLVILVLSLGLIYFTTLLPGGNALDVLIPATSIFLASIITIAVSQFIDIEIYHKLADLTDGRWLFVRNVGSTYTSQFLDTALFTILAFSIFPILLPGKLLGFDVLLSIIVVEYIVKVVLATMDTPVIYGVVNLYE